MCLCDPASSSPSQYQPSAVSQASFQTGSAVVQQPQTKLEDIERDSLTTAYGQKTQQQLGKPAANIPVAAQQQPAYRAVGAQQQYFIPSYQTQQQQFYIQPFQAQPQYFPQPYQSVFDYPAVQYLVNSNAYNPGSPIYQQYYIPAAQPSPIPQYVTKQLSPAVQTQPKLQNSITAQITQEYKQQFAAPVQPQQEYKQQQFATPAQVQQQQFAATGQAPQEYKQQQLAIPPQAQQEYKQQQFATPTEVQQEYKQQQLAAIVPVQTQQQYVLPSSAFQYSQQPAAAAAAASPVDFSYVTRHLSGNEAANIKSTAVQSQLKYSEVPQQYYQPQNYYTVPSATAVAATGEQSRVQQSAKSQYSSGIKSTTPFPLKEPFAYKFESSPLQQQQSGAAYSTIKRSA